jgi:hypothetical protein
MNVRASSPREEERLIPDLRGPPQRAPLSRRQAGRAGLGEADVEETCLTRRAG